MRILVTGAKGLVGGPLVRRLRAAGHEVEGVDVGDFDVRDRDACIAAVAMHRPERVAHLAAWVDVDGAEERPDEAAAVNAGGARNMAEACRSAGAAMLYVSTDYVFDGQKGGPYREDDPTNPQSVYGRTKLDGERHVREIVPRPWIVRCQSIYGDGGTKSGFVDAIRKKAMSGGSPVVVADQFVCPSWSEDVATCLAAVLLTAPPGTYHAANSGSCSWHECAETIVKLERLEVEVRKKTASQHAAERAADGRRTAVRPTNSAFDCRALADATGVSPRRWDEALLAYLTSRRPKGAAR